MLLLQKEYLLGFRLNRSLGTDFFTTTNLKTKSERKQKRSLNRSTREHFMANSRNRDATVDYLEPIIDYQCNCNMECINRVRRTDWGLVRLVSQCQIFEQVQTPVTGS